MKVTATNGTGLDGLYLDSVQVSSTEQKLCGSAALDLTADGAGNAYYVHITQTSGTATMACPRGPAAR